VYMNVLMSRSARMRVSDAAAIFRDSADLMLVMSLWHRSGFDPIIMCPGLISVSTSNSLRAH
jgi:hypothetical protein